MQQESGGNINSPSRTHKKQWGFFSKETVPPTPTFSFPSLLLILSSFHAVVVLIGKEESSQLAAKNQADALQLKMVQG